MASLFWVGGTGNWDGTTNHFATTSGGSATVALTTTADDVTFDASSGGGTVTITATANCLSLTGGAFTGTLNTNGQTVNCTGTFSFSGTGTRTLTLGASTINCGSWVLQTTTNLTFNANTSTIAVTAVTGNNFHGGAFTYSTVTMAGGTTTNTLNQANTFGTLTLNGNANKTSSFVLATSQTITGTLTITGNSATNRILFNTQTAGTTMTLTCTGASVNYSNVDFQDITITNGTLGTNTSVGDCGGNTGITFTISADQHWLNASSSSWSTAGNWTSRVPLPQDNVFMDKAFGTSQTITADMPRLGKSIDWTGATWTTNLTWACSGTTGNFGSLTLISGLTFTLSSNNYEFYGRGSYTLKTFGVDMNTSAWSLNVKMVTGTLQFLDSLTSTGNGLVLFHGTLDANNFDFSGHVFNVAAQVGSLSRTLNMGSGTWTFDTTVSTPWNSSTTSGTTINAQTSTIKFPNTSSQSVTMSCGVGQTFYNLWFARGTSTGENTIGASSGTLTFNQIKDTGTVAHTLSFPTVATIAVADFQVNGNGAGNEITVTTSLSNTQVHNLSYTGASVVSCDYLNISHSSAIPATNTWYAGANSINNQDTTSKGKGWNFTAVEPVMRLRKGSSTDGRKPSPFKPGGATPKTKLFPKSYPQ